MRKGSARLGSGELLALLSGVLWAVSAALGQFLFERGVSAFWLVPFRLTCAGLLLLLWYALRGGDVLAPLRTGRDAWDLTLLALVGTAAAQLSYFAAVEASNAVTGTFLCYLSPLFVLLWTLLRQRRPPTRRETAAAALVLGGIFLLCTHGDVRSLVISTPALLWGLMSAVTFAFYTVQPARLLRRYPPPLVSGWGMLLGGLALLLGLRAWRYPGVRDGAGWLAFLLAVAVGTLLAFSCYLLAVRRIGPARTGLLSSAQPAAAALIGLLFFHQRFAGMDLLGFACVLAVPFLLREEPKNQESEVAR